MKLKPLFALLVPLIFLGCLEARAVNRPWVEFWQDADSARIVVSWSAAPQIGGQEPTAYYEVEVIASGRVLASDTTSAFRDTLTIAYPPPNSSLSFLARVRTFDIDGDSSGWVESNLLTLVSNKLPPSPPDSVRADTLAAVPVPVGALRFGDHPADVLLWTEDFERYADTRAMTLAGGGPWNRSSDSRTTLDPTGGIGGSRALKIIKDGSAGGQGGGQAGRGGLGSPTHFFLEYQFRFVDDTPGNPSPRSKWLIIHHNAESDPGCLGNVTRYQFGMTRDASVYNVVPPKPRFAHTGEQAGCDGPSTGLTGGFFNWGADPNEGAPVLSTDPDIGDVPWNAIDDGLWHKHTIEIKVGDGVDSWSKLWLDGFPYWDSTGSPMNMLGIPTQVLYELVSGSTTGTTYSVWYDAIITWKR